MVAAIWHARAYAKIHNHCRRQFGDHICAQIENFVEIRFVVLKL